MGWLLFEVFLALAVAIAIVWWTFPSRPKDRTGDDAKRDTDQRKGS